MNLLQLEQETARRLDRLDFDRLWPGFRRYEFALYDDSHAVLNGQLIPRPADFWANTALSFQGRTLAVWKVGKDMDGDYLAAKLAHEMFHAHQTEQGDGRFANEIRAAGRIRPTPEYLQLRYEENLLLVRLSRSFDPGLWNRVLSLRRTRREFFPYEYDYECRVEAIEGAAQYVELEALVCLAPERHAKSLELLTDRVDWVWPLFSPRPLCYDTGALFLRILLQNSLPVDQTIDPNALFFGQELVDAAPPLPSLPEPSRALLAAIRDNQKELRRRAARICARCSSPRRGDFQLLGFNCYDPKRLGSYIFSYGFLSYRDANSQTVTLTEGDFMFRMDGERLVEVMGSF